MAKHSIVVLGAGVSGLTSALLLSQNPDNEVTVIAKHMPGDVDIEYCSPWAGANYLPFSAKDSKTSQCRNKDGNTTIGKWTTELTKPDPWYRDVVPNFANIPSDRLDPGVDNANTFTSVCINAAIYLPWLVSQCLKAGVVFRRTIVQHVTEAADFSPFSSRKANLVINCTGLSSLKLGGVQDKTLHAARGQIVVVRNHQAAMHMISGVDDSNEESTYTMTRPAGGGTILGGSYQMDNWDSQPDPNLAVRIMKRCIELCPGLVTPGQGIEGLSIVRHGVGLRPLREDGPRVDVEKIGGVWVVHNYGHGGYGYQTSYGCAETVVELAGRVLTGKKGSREQPHL
ncbi:D-amino acid oxidase [Sporothrix stenoceras]|uniref:D-amino acid oxidase n=1 Tax=Sporothrix stenoceras TaxID=5173 RepID=A0ABR3YKR2_9PEZI